MYTVILNTNGRKHYYPCATQDDMVYLRSALILKYGDLQVEITQKNPPARRPAANDARVGHALTDLDGGNTVKPRRAGAPYRRASKGR